MNDVFSLIFSQDFLVRALAVGVLISVCAALLGVSLVLKRFSMIGDGLSHVSFGAMAIAAAANIAPLYFSLPIVVVAAFLLLRMSEKGKIKGDAAIALISTGALAVGVMATSLTSGMNIDIYNYMFGSILTMSSTDVTVTAVLCAVIIFLFIAFYHQIFAVTFDESFAKATGTKASFYNMVIAALTAVTVVIGMRMMGALLISSLIIFPTVTSMRLCRSYRSVVYSSVAVSLFCFISGLVFSIKYEAPTGASVVIVNIILLGVFSLLGSVRKISANSRLHPVKSVLVCFVCGVCTALFAAVLFSGSVNIYEKEKTTVVTTSFASYDFSRQIAGDDAEVIMLLSPGEESHTFEPTPNDMLAIKQCDVFVYGGGESEAWVETVLEEKGADMIKVKMMDCVQLYEEEFTDGMEHGHEHGEQKHHGEAEYDEHVWTSPLNAVLITDAVCDALCDADSVNAESYRGRAESYKKELRKLDDDISEAVRNAEHSYIVVGDRFPLRYFTERYSLGYYAAFPGCSAQTEANPVTIANLCDKVSSEKIPVVFKVDLSSGTVAYSISEQTGADVETLYSCHTVSADDFNGGETYISLMYRNLEALKKAIS